MQNNKSFKKAWMSLSFASLMLLAGCGESANSDSKALTGVLVDSPVEGVSYSTASFSGTTDSAGRFEFNAGETVTFSIGELVFPAVEAKAVVTPLSLAGTTDINDPVVQNIARLLQSLDADANPDNGIRVEQGLVTAELDFTLSPVEFAAQALAKMNLNLVSRAKAMEHLSAQLSARGVSYELSAESTAPATADEILAGGVDMSRYTDGVYVITPATVAVDQISEPANSSQNTVVLNEGEWNQDSLDLVYLDFEPDSVSVYRARNLWLTQDTQDLDLLGQPEVYERSSSNQFSYRQDPTSFQAEEGLITSLELDKKIALNDSGFAQEVVWQDHFGTTVKSQTHASAGSVVKVSSVSLAEFLNPPLVFFPEISSETSLVVHDGFSGMFQYTNTTDQPQLFEVLMAPEVSDVPYQLMTWLTVANAQRQILGTTYFNQGQTVPFDTDLNAPIDPDMLFQSELEGGFVVMPGDTLLMHADASVNIMTSPGGVGGTMTVTFNILPTELTEEEMTALEAALETPWLARGFNLNQPPEENLDTEGGEVFSPAPPSSCYGGLKFC